MTATNAVPAIPPHQQARHKLSPASVYAFYESLHAAGHKAQLGGSLLLYRGLQDGGRIAALAGNIAGVATLGIEADTAALKQAVVDGVCDFRVNSLDEALRILKNEVRKKQAVSVCLQQDFTIALAEIVERGVQPDFLAPGDFASLPDAQVLRSRGAVAVAAKEGQGIGVAHGVGVAPPAMGVAWTALTAPALWLPKIAAIAAAVIDPADEQRQRWLHFASRYLGRLTQGTHFMPMTIAEAAEFRRVLDQQVANGSIGCAVRITLDGALADGSEKSVIEISAKK